MQSAKHNRAEVVAEANELTGALKRLRDRLKFAAEERLRLENEGGKTASKAQVKRTESLLEAARRIDRTIPDIEHVFSDVEDKENA